MGDRRNNIFFRAKRIDEARHAHPAHAGEKVKNDDDRDAETSLSSRHTCGAPDERGTPKCRRLRHSRHHRTHSGDERRTPVSSGPWPPRVLYHYPSSLPFPIALTDDFPSEPYRSRGSDVKHAIHWGQRKLLLSEIQLLSLYCRPHVSYHIVYAGSAPGTHIAFLDDMFGRIHTWELVDPGQFNRPVLDPRANMTLRNEFFTNATAYGISERRLRHVCPALGELYAHLTTAPPSTASPPSTAKDDIQARLQDMVGTLDVARGTEDIPCMYEPPAAMPVGLELLIHVALERATPLLFVSDVRSGSVALANFEEHVAENMRAQAVWTTVLQGEYSLLKFRLPYTVVRSRPGGVAAPRTTFIDADGTVSYLRGDILLPIWTRPTSTEGRLVVPRASCGVYTRYNVAKVENQFFFFNARVREQIHFNHLLDAHTILDHSYDAAAEVNCLATYLLFRYPHLRQDASALRREVDQLSRRITEELGCTFEDCIARRHRHAICQAREQEATPSSTAAGGDGPGEDSGGADERRTGDDDARREDASWVRALHDMSRHAARERKRAVMWRNVDEATDSPADAAHRGIWVTRTMEQ